MEKPSITTIIVIICILIIGLYAMGEVNYFSSKIIVERNIESPTVLIPSIGVKEKINNVSLDQGVLHELESYTPDKGDVLLFGHRT
ncbi:MAG: sortase, partial [Methanobrevibacter sp.]|nr:sortase [Methanobrevibacter sp.]